MWLDGLRAGVRRGPTARDRAMQCTAVEVYGGGRLLIAKGLLQ